LPEPVTYLIIDDLLNHIIFHSKILLTRNFKTLNEISLIFADNAAVVRKTTDFCKVSEEPTSPSYHIKIKVMKRKTYPQELSAIVGTQDVGITDNNSIRRKANAPFALHFP